MLKKIKTAFVDAVISNPPNYEGGGELELENPSLKKVSDAKSKKEKEDKRSPKDMIAIKDTPEIRPTRSSKDKGSPKFRHRVGDHQYINKTSIHVGNNNGVIQQGCSTVNVYRGCRGADEGDMRTPRGPKAFNVHLEPNEEGSRSTRRNSDQKSKLREEITSCNQPLSVYNKYLVADGIGDKWKRLARMLPGAEFTNAQLFNLGKQSESQAELVVDILNRWSEMAPESATVAELARTLEKMHLADLAEDLVIE